MNKLLRITILLILFVSTVFYLTNVSLCATKNQSTAQKKQNAATTTKKKRSTPTKPLQKAVPKPKSDNPYSNKPLNSFSALELLQAIGNSKMVGEIMTPDGVKSPLTMVDKNEGSTLTFLGKDYRVESFGVDGHDKEIDFKIYTTNKKDSVLYFTGDILKDEIRGIVKDINNKSGTWFFKPEYLFTYGNADMGPYVNKVVRDIKHNWLHGRCRTDTPIVVRFTVMRNGTVSNLQIRKSSGNRVFDDTALDAVKKSVPFDELPAEYTAQSITLEVTLETHKWK